MITSHMAMFDKAACNSNCNSVGGHLYMPYAKQLVGCVLNWFYLIVIVCKIVFVLMAGEWLSHGIIAICHVCNEIAVDFHTSTPLYWVQEII